MLQTLKNLPKDSVYSKLSSPVGNLSLIASDQGLHGLLWDTDLKKDEYAAVVDRLAYSDKHPIIAKTKEQLGEYFAGKRFKFDIPLVVDGTSFQKSAWTQLRKIPYGKTISYQEQASWVGDARKARAVGAANSRNPISIIVPCHRVIAKNGDLTGFGGGLHNKKFLIELEQHALSR